MSLRQGLAREMCLSVSKDTQMGVAPCNGKFVPSQRDVVALGARRGKDYSTIFLESGVAVD